MGSCYFLPSPAPSRSVPPPSPCTALPKGGGLRHSRSAQRARVPRFAPPGQALLGTAGLGWERRGTPGPGGLRGRPRLPRPPLPGAGAPASLPLSIILGRLRVCRSLLVVAVNHSVCPSSIGKTKPPYAGNRRVGDYSWIYEVTAVDWVRPRSGGVSMEAEGDSSSGGRSFGRVASLFVKPPSGCSWGKTARVW